MTPLDATKKVLIRTGPGKGKEMGLMELEEDFTSNPNWKVIEKGGVLSIPVEEFRMINPPKPDRKGKVEFEKKKAGTGGMAIEN